MPLSAPALRQSLHHRDIEVRGYLRDDGLFDIEGHIRDYKDYDLPMKKGTRHAGESVHSMWLRLTINDTLQIIDAEAVTEAAPHETICGQITPEYQKLIGVTIGSGFTAKVKDLLGGINGCTHITELIRTVATVAYQTLTINHKKTGGMPAHALDGCHALRRDGPIVAEFHPQWYVKDRNDLVTRKTK